MYLKIYFVQGLMHPKAPSTGEFTKHPKVCKIYSNYVPMHNEIILANSNNCSAL